MIRFALKKSTLNRQKLYTATLWNLHRRKFHSGHQPPLEAGLGKYLVILSPIAIGAGVVAYAKYDPKFRKTLVDTIPGADPVLKVLLQEEGNALDEASKSISNATKKVVEAKDTIVGYFGGSSPSEKPAEPKAKDSKPPTSGKTTSSSSVASPPLPTLSPPPASKSTEATQKPSVSTPTVASKKSISSDKPSQPPTAPVKLEPVVPVQLPKTLVELEKSLEVAAQIAVREYDNAIQHLKQYSEDVKTVVDHVIEKADHTVWSTLKNKTSARDTAVEAAERTAQEARAHIEKLEKHVGSIAKDVAPELLEKTHRNIRVISEELNKSKEKLYTAKDSASLAERYWKKVEEARNYFVDQMEALFPGIDLTAKKLNLAKDDIDLFIMHAYSHVIAYQKELQKINIEGEVRLRRALDALKGDDQTEAVKHQVEYLLEKEKQNLNIANQKKIFNIQAENETKLRQQLRKQAEAHVDHLNDAVTEKEKELRRNFNRELNEKLSLEQATYKIQLATMLGKLKGMDSALKEIEKELEARADADRQVHQAQALWSACSALWSSMRTTDPKAPWQKQLRPLQNEVAAIRNAAEGDELVKLVLNSLPAEAKARGVYPENAIRERFLKVEKLARQLALVPEEGAGIPTYVLSYLQSALVLQPNELISPAELNNEPIDVQKLSTFDVLNRTRYYVDRGNFVQALKYANLLKGASRRVANDWINETRLLLETQQAADVLLTHAATSGLSFL